MFTQNAPTNDPIYNHNQAESVIYFMVKTFDNQDLRNISDVLSEIVTHTKITEYLQEGNISEVRGSNKSDRIFYALKDRQDKDGCGNNVIAFILRIITPKRYKDELEFENHRTQINEKLAFAGYIFRRIPVHFEG